MKQEATLNDLILKGVLEPFIVCYLQEPDCDKTGLYRDAQLLNILLDMMYVFF